MEKMLKIYLTLAGMLNIYLESAIFLDSCFYYVGKVLNRISK